MTYRFYKESYQSFLFRSLVVLVSKLGVTMSKNGFGQIYRKLSSKLLDLVVTPQVLGEVPSEVTAPATDQTAPASQKIICYVLQNHSRSNALVVDAETRRLKIPPALDSLEL